jgi:hypothetical protein
LCKDGTQSLIFILRFPEKNIPPISRAGGNLTVTLPTIGNVIYLNGSQSSDDLGIVNFTWTRESGSLAVGDFIGNSDREAVLMVRFLLGN